MSLQIPHILNFTEIIYIWVTMLEIQKDIPKLFNGCISLNFGVIKDRWYLGVLIDTYWDGIVIILCEIIFKEDEFFICSWIFLADFDLIAHTNCDLSIQ